MPEDVYVFPLSFAQQRLWFMEALTPGTPLFNISTAVRWRMPVSAARLQASLNRLVARHEVLRTTFAVVDGEPVQVVAESREFPLAVDDLSTVTAATADQLVADIVADEARTVFDLTAGPLVRARLVRLAPDDHVFVVSMHHMVTDGWSMGVFWNELKTHWDLAPGASDVLPPLPLQYGDYAVWERESLAFTTWHPSLQYWIRQ